MIRNFKKTIGIFLCLVTILSVFTCTAVAADTVKRVSCVMVDNGACGRGFFWYTYENGNSDLQIVKTSEFDGTFANAKTYTGSVSLYRKQYVHKVYVYDLEAGTSYTYRVGDLKKNIWSDTCTITTDDRDDNFSFVTIADVQASSDENFKHASFTLKAALEICPQAAFIANLGDYVNDNTNDEWDWYFKNFAFANNNYTQVPVAGNHDGNITNKLNTFCFQNIFALDESDNRSLEGVYYSFDYGNSHIAVLNTNDMYPMTQAQRNWLINDMKASDAEWKLIFMHRSLYSAGKNINKPDTVIMRDVLLPIIDELDIDMVYAGHDHMYLRTTQVYGDAAVNDTECITETVNGESITFALNPKGTVYTLPSTAGTKRYTVNQNALKPILSVADKAFTTRDRGGCFCVTEIDGDKLIYKAYIVDDDTKETELVDTYAIMKTDKNLSQDSNLDQTINSTIKNYPTNFAAAIVKMLINYVKLLIDVII